MKENFKKMQKEREENREEDEEDHSLGTSALIFTKNKYGAGIHQPMQHLSNASQMSLSKSGTGIRPDTFRPKDE